MAQYSVKDKSLAQLVDDLETWKVQGAVGAGSYELVQAAIMAKAAEASNRWARVASFASLASVVVSIAALIVALCN